MNDRHRTAARAQARYDRARYQRMTPLEQKLYVYGMTIKDVKFLARGVIAGIAKGLAEPISVSFRDTR